jgi:hypothetical protein
LVGEQEPLRSQIPADRNDAFFVGILGRRKDQLLVE